MKKHYKRVLKRLICVLFPLFTIVNSFAQVPACTPTVSPVSSGTLASPATPFTWTAPSGTVTGYRIYIGTTVAATELINGTVITSPTTSYTYNGTLNCGTTYYWRVVPYNVSGPAVGCSVQSFTLTNPGDPSVYPVGSWNAYCFNSTTWTNYTGYYTSTGQDFDSRTVWTSNNQSPSSVTGGASNYQGCSVPVDNHSISYKRQGFTPGTYSLNIVHDDACFIFLNGTQIYTRAGATGTFINSVWTGNLDGNSQIEFRWLDTGGGSHGGITFVPITTPTLVAGTIAGTQSLCFGNTDPAAFTSTLAASGTCSPVTYQWQNDVNCTGTFTDIAGATNATYDAPAGVTQTTCYRRMVVDANCGRSLASNIITVTVYATPPGDPSIIPSNSWTGYVYGFSTYSSADAGWTDYRGSFSYTGPSDPSFNTSTIYTTANVPSTAPNYTGCAVTANLNGVQLKRQGFPTGTYSIDFSSDDAGYLYINNVLVYSRTTNGSQTNVWTGNLDALSTVELRYKNNTSTALGALTFNLIPTPTLNPGVIAGNQILCPGNNPYPFTIVTPVSGACSAVLSYQWQQDVGCTGTWADISGATLSTYDVPAGITQTTCYRRAVTDANCSRTDYSNTLTVTVTSVPQGDPTVFPINSWNAYVYDFSVTGYTTADNNWTDYKGFYPINTVSFNTTSYYAANVVPSAAPGYTGCQLANYPLTGVQIKRQGFPTGTYQIDFSSDDAGFLYVNGVLVYSRAGNGTATNVWIGNLDATSTIDYRYKNNGGNGSGALTFTIVTPTIPLTEGGIALNGPSTICPTNSVTPIISTSDAASSCYLYYQWQVDSTGTGFIDVTGATSASYTPTSLSTSASFRRKVTDACGDVAYSNTVNINVGPSTPPDASIFGANSWIAYVYNQQSYVPASLFGSYTDPGVSATDPSFNSNSYWTVNSTPSLASTYTGCQVGIDNHSVIYKRQGFPAGTYTLNVLNDDACQLFIDGVLVYSRGAWTPTFINGVWTGVLGATTQVEFRWTEGSGGSYGAVTFILQTTPGPLDGGTISNVTTQVCSGDVPTAFTSTTLPSNGCSVAAYQWQLDTGSGYSDITGATNVTYTPVAQTLSTSYRRRVTDACSQIAYSNVFVISVAAATLPDPSVFGVNKWNVYAYNDVNFTQLRGSYVDNGFSASDPSFDSRNKWGISSSASSAAGYTGCSVALDQHGVIYKRQGFPSGIYRLDYNSDDAGSVYINGVLVYSSVSWGTLVTDIWTGTLNSSSTVEYRWADTGGGQSYGQLVMVRPVVPTTLVAGTIANSATTVCSGDTPPPFTSTAPASGGCYKTYQWQSSTASASSGFSNITGATSATYTPTAITVRTFYRRRVTDACGTSVNSNVITINVGVPSPPTITWGNGQWNAYVYNTRTFTGLSGSYIEPNTSAVNYSFDTRNSWTTTTRPSLAATYAGCQVGDNTFSVSYRQTNFASGTYQITLEADDDAVLIIDGVTRYTGTNICCTPVVAWTGTLGASSQVEIRYGENNGNAYCKATLTSTTPAPLLPGTIGSDQSICSNVVPAVLTSVTDATSGCAITYQWQRSTTSATGPWTNIGGNTSSFTPTPPGQTATSYYIRNATDACGRTASSNVVTVTVNPRPNNAGAITGITNVCSGQAGVTYSIAAVNNATSYTWVIPSDATITSGDGTNSITVTFGSTSGDVTVQPVNACGTGLTSTIAVTVVPSIPATAGAISGLATVCQAQFDELYTIAAVPGASSYIWTLPTGATFISGSTTVSPRITFGAVGGTISVTPTNGCGNALTSSDLNVTMIPTPSAAGAITGTGTVCPGQAGVTYSIAAVANTTTYNWSLPAGAVITSGAGTRSIVVTFGSTSGNVTVTPTNSCGTGTSRSIVVSVISLGSTGTISGLNPVCQNTTNVVYTIPVTTGASTYTWTVPSGSTIVSGNGTRILRVDIGTTSGNITVTPSNTCQTGTASVLALDVTNTVPSPAGAITGDNNPCRAEAGVSYSIAAVPGATGYIWTVPSGASVITGATTNAITVNYNTASGNVVATPNNVCGNGTASTLPVTLKPFPSAVGAITGSISVCKTTGQTYTYSVLPVANALNYTWTVPTDATIISGDGTTSIVVSYTSASVTTGNITVVASNTCSSTTRSLGVTISDCPNTWTGSLTTDWNTAGNWSANAIPTSVDEVLIPNVTRKPVIASGASGNVKAITINTNSSLTINSTGTLNAYGSITNNGTVTANSGSNVALLGSTAQTITGVLALSNVQVNNTSGVSILSPLTINGTLSLLNGALTTNNFLTINFDNGGNIAYLATDNGSIVGNVSGRRFVVAKTHYIAAPFSGSTSLQVAQTTPIWVSPYWKMFTRVFSSQNWSAVINNTTAMPLGTGFSLSFPAAAPLVLTGTYNHNYTLTGTSYSNAAAGKFILVGNPYPSTLDWDNASGWTKSNIAGAVYYWDGPNQRTASYVSGVGTNGGTQFIPAMQSFLVATTGTGGLSSSVSINNDARSTSNQAYWRNSSGDEQLVGLSIKSPTGMVDETVVRFDESSSNLFDTDVDAYKVMNNIIPSLYTKTTASSTEYSINTLPMVGSSTMIPLNLKVPADGVYELNCSKYSVLGYNLILEDKLTGEFTPINESSVLPINASRTDSTNRFVLRFAENITTRTNSPQTTNIQIATFDNSLVLSVDGIVAEGVTIEVYSADGNKVQVVTNQSIASGVKIIPMNSTLSSGVYLVKFNIGDNYYAGKVVIQ